LYILGNQSFGLKVYVYLKLKKKKKWFIPYSELEIDTYLIFENKKQKLQCVMSFTSQVTEEMKLI